MDNSIYENYVRQVVSEGSLTGAAEKIGITQPALSSGLKALEKKIGIRIFNRNLTPVTLTEEGQIYFDYIKRKNALASDFEARIDACKKDRDFHVIIGSPVVYSEYTVSRAVCRLLEVHPEYSISIRTASLNRLIESASDGKLDCFISTSDKLPEEFILQEIKRERICLCVPKDRQINLVLKKIQHDQGVITDLTCLTEENFILLEKDQPIRLLLDPYLAKQGITLKSNVSVNQVSTSVDLASMGLGCCFASEDALFQPSIRDRLCVYSLPETVFSRPIYAVRHREFYQTRACRDLITGLREYA